MTIAEELELKGKIEGKVEGKIEGKIEGRIEGKVEGKKENIVEFLEIIAPHLLERYTLELEEARTEKELETVKQKILDNLRKP